MELLIGAVLGGVITWAVTAHYYRKDTRREDARARDARIEKVADDYCKGTGIVTGFDGLIRRNVALLETDDEVRELFDRIERRGKKRPLRKYESLFENVELSRFLRWAGKERLDAHNTTIDEMIRRFKDVEPDRWKR